MTPAWWQVAAGPLVYSSSFRPLAEAPGMSPLALHPALPTLQHSTQCLFFVSEALEIFVVMEVWAFLCFSGN